MDPSLAVPSVFLCEPQWEQALEHDLGSLKLEQIRIVAPGWVEGSIPSLGATAGLSAAFAAQCLYDAAPIRASSVSQWSRLAAEGIVAQFRDHPGPWRLHVFSRYADSEITGHRRAALVRQALMERLKRSQRRLLRTLHEPTSPVWRSSEALVQVALLSPTEGYLSITPAGRLDELRRVVSRYPAGVVHVVAQPQAPSRAFRKLAEVELRLDRFIAPGETCVDLGSSPGSWAWLALARGASVVAIDRSPLRADLMEHPRLSFVAGDAFKYAPPDRVDWLLSDIIAFPGRIQSLLDVWLSRAWCRRFCVTIKFRGDDEYPILNEFRSLLEARNVDYALRRLTHNRNEVTAYGVLRGQSQDVVGC